MTWRNFITFLGGAAIGGRSRPTRTAGNAGDRVPPSVSN